MTWRGDFSEKAITRHAASLAVAQRDEHKVWVVFDYTSAVQLEMQKFAHPQYTLVFTAISIPASQKARSVRVYVFSRVLPCEKTSHSFLSAQLPLDTVANGVRQSLIEACIIGVFLRSDANPAEPYYDITDHFAECLRGDLNIAAKLLGRTIFVLHYTARIDGHNTDVLSPEGIDVLIQKVYEPYMQTFGDYSSNVILGFCVELPDFLCFDRAPANTLPWTPGLPDYFADVKNYDLLERLPLLFYDAYEAATIRHDFWQVLTQRYADVCLTRLRDWCHIHGLQLAVTHPPLARSLTRNALPLFASADIPGVHLRFPSKSSKGESLNPDKRIVLLKQSASVAEQFGAPTLIQQDDSIHTGAPVEAWIRNLHEQVIAGGNQFAISHPSTMMDNLDVYLRRLSFVMSCGRRRCNLLVLNPIGSLWAKFGHQDWHWINSELASISSALINAQHDYDFGDESLLTTYGHIHKRSKKLIVGDVSYKAVLIPPCITLQSATIVLLRRFISARGKLIAMESLPYLMDGKTGDYAYPLEKLLYKRRTTILRGTQEEKLRQLMVLMDKIAGDGIVIYSRPDNLKTQSIRKHHRQYENIAICFLLNVESHSVDTLVEIAGEVCVEEWNSEYGERDQPTQWHADKKTYAELHFEAGQARLMVIG